MSNITSSDLAFMRAELGAMMDQLASILRATVTRDDFGGIKQSFNAIAINVPCLVGGLTRLELERMVAEQLQAGSNWAIDFPTGTDLTEKDKVQIGSTVYEVLNVNDQPQSYQLTVRATVREVK